MIWVWILETANIISRVTDLQPVTKIILSGKLTAGPWPCQMHRHQMSSRYTTCAALCLGISLLIFNTGQSHRKPSLVFVQSIYLHVIFIHTVIQIIPCHTRFSLLPLKGTFLKNGVDFILHHTECSMNSVDVLMTQGAMTKSECPFHVHDINIRTRNSHER